MIKNSLVLIICNTFYQYVCNLYGIGLINNLQKR